MADKVIPVDVRAAIVTWPKDAPRGAVSRFCVEHGISRSQFYEIRRLALAEGPLAAMTRRPRAALVRHPQAVESEIEDLAVTIRKQLADEGWDHGPLTVRHKLLDMGIKAPAASTLARIFARRGMVVAQPQKRPRTRWRRFEAATVHECWQLDGFDWHLIDGTVFCILQVTDDKSRFPIATRAAAGERSADAIAVITAGIARFQTPCRVLTDNGSAFNRSRLGSRTALVEMLENLGCRPVTGAPGHPQTQGKNERAHQTLQRWLTARPLPTDLADAQRLLNQFDAAFAQRRHQGLGMQTPATVLKAGPTAIPPTPATPPAAPNPVRSSRHRVAANGNLDVRRITIHLDLEHRSTDVTVITAGNVLTVFDHQGNYLRTIHLEPGKTYYSNGRPRGPQPKPKCPD